MNAGSKSVRRFAANNAYLSRDNTCTSCLNRLSLQARQYASAAAAPLEPSSSTQAQHSDPVAIKGHVQKAYSILASPVVSRPPLITRDLTGFEKAYFLYQKRLNERLALPFSRYFYYKKGTPADVEWKRKARNRRTAARDIGVYSGYGDEAWNDEVLMGDQTADLETQREALIRDAEGREILAAEAVGDKEANQEKVSGDAKVEGTRKELELHVERPASRITEADEKNDTSSLNRKLDQTLYLLVKNKDGRWRFPEDRMFVREDLNQAAERIIVQSAGLNMNTWVVGNHPVAHYHFDFPKPRISELSHHQPEEGAVETNTYKQEEFGEKVFFMKARIMAGQADVSKSVFGDQAFQWLTKGEIEGLVTRKYWSSIKNMLMDR